MLCVPSSKRVFGNRLNALMDLTINGSPETVRSGELLIEVINRGDVKIPQVCYHPQLGPLQTCDTCMVELDGKLVRACATHAAEGTSVNTSSPRADVAQREAFDRILGNHLLYCTVCDNNNGNCTVHNTTILLRVEHQKIPYQPKPYEADMSNPFYRYDPDQCIPCGRGVQACQTLGAIDIAIRKGARTGRHHREGLRKQTVYVHELRESNQLASKL
jgi:formate dehydrogenase major subunit